MDITDIRKLLNESNNKLDILSSLDIIVAYNLSVKDFIDLVSEFLGDEEKLKLLESPDFKQVTDTVKGRVIDVINDENVCLKVKNNAELMKSLTHYNAVNLIKKLGDQQKKQVLYDEEFLKKYKFGQYDIEGIVFSLNDELKNEVAQDKNLLVDKLNFPDYKIVELCNQIQSEEIKINMIKKYGWSRDTEINIIAKGFSSESKLKILSNDDLTNSEKITLIKSLDEKSLGEFF